MKKRLSALALALVGVTGLVAFGMPDAHADATPPLRIMPLGDSITYGLGSSTTSSYRADLWNKLTATGAQLDFVGSAHSGALPDTDNEGHSGWRIDQIADIASCAVAKSRPNLVTLHLGTNDMGQDYQTGTAPQRLGALVDQLLAADPGVTVLVASLVPSNDPAEQARTVTFNQQLPGLVGQQQAAGKHVRLVDMSAVTTSDLSDPWHPNDNGYRKMATAFAAGVQDSIGAGWISSPAAPGTGCAHGVIRNGASGQCLDAGAGVQLWDCNGGDNQQFSTTAAGEIRFAGRCLDAGWDRSTVQLWDCNGGTNQKWTVVPDGAIVGTESGKCLDAGARIQLWDCNGGANQRWLSSVAGVLRGQESGRCADVSGGSTAPGAKPVLWDCNGAANQAWTSTANGLLTVYDNRCLDVSGGGTTDGTPVVIWSCNGGANQLWAVRADGSVVSAATGKCLDAAFDGTANSTALVLWTCTGGANQKWNRS